MSPAHKAARREQLLREVEILDREATQLERELEAKDRIHITSPASAAIAKRAEHCAVTAMRKREALRLKLVEVTRLTDYRDALDKPSADLLAKLEKLAADAQRNELRPSQVNAALKDKWMDAPPDLRRRSCRTAA